MEAWRDVFRRGVAPYYSRPNLEALAGALRGDDPRLIQGHTTLPLPLESLRGCPTEAACALAYPLWLSGEHRTVNEVEREFARLCGSCDQAIDERGGIRHLLNWIDATPRDEMRRELLAEVTRTLAERTPHEPPAAPADVGPAGPDDRAVEAGA